MTVRPYIRFYNSTIPHPLTMPPYTRLRRFMQGSNCPGLTSHHCKFTVILDRSWVCRLSRMPTNRLMTAYATRSVTRQWCFGRRITWIAHICRLLPDDTWLFLQVVCRSNQCSVRRASLWTVDNPVLLLPSWTTYRSFTTIINIFRYMMALTDWLISELHDSDSELVFCCETDHRDQDQMCTCSNLQCWTVWMITNYLSRPRPIFLRLTGRPHRALSLRYFSNSLRSTCTQYGPALSHNCSFFIFTSPELYYMYIVNQYSQSQ